MKPKLTIIEGGKGKKLTRKDHAIYLERNAAYYTRKLRRHLEGMEALNNLKRLK